MKFIVIMRATINMNMAKAFVVRKKVLDVIEGGYYTKKNIERVGVDVEENSIV